MAGSLSPSRHGARGGYRKAGPSGTLLAPATWMERRLRTFRHFSPSTLRISQIFRLAQSPGR